MTATARDELARLLAGGSASATHARLDVDLHEFRVTVSGVGQLRKPVTPAQIRKLVALSSPAPYGLGEQTLTDARVRHTWQVPNDAVSVDWGDRFDDVLDTARSELGLPVGSQLTAQFHSMLLYERGHFFAPHRDSEKDDAMVATLAVILPSAHSGGELVMHDGDRETAYAGTRYEPTVVVWYADRVHEVRPVRTGHRITLTYNLLVQRAGGPVAADLGPVAQAAALLQSHFTTRPTARWPGDDRSAPRRLAFLLDHQYSRASLSWSRLKGVDGERVALLRAAAQQAGCEVVLALAEIHETREANSDVGNRRYGYASDHLSDDDGEEGWDEEWRDEPEYVPEFADAESDSLLDSEMVLTEWRVVGDRALRPVRLSLHESEVCASTPTALLRPYDSSYEGYLGNYGNTVDRWYRRALVLIWPVEASFSNRAEASPAAALDNLLARLARRGAGRPPADLQTDTVLDAVLADARSLEPFWEQTIGGHAHQEELLDPALRVAAELADPDTATMLLDPFSIQSLRPGQVPSLVALTHRHGADMVAAVVGRWVANPVASYGWQERESWIAELPRLCAGLDEARAIAEEMIRLAWSGLQSRVTPLLAAQPTTHVRRELGLLGPPAGAVLHATAIVGNDRSRDRIVASCTQDQAVLPLVLPLLHKAEAWAPQLRRETRVGEVAAYAIGVLTERLARPTRSLDDWSIVLSSGCDCELCRRLASFLADPAARHLDWPVAKAGRQHMHARIDAAELPVTHTTRRSGRPYTLVLTKTVQLFEREIDLRREDGQALDHLVSRWQAT